MESRKYSVEVESSDREPLSRDTSSGFYGEQEIHLEDTSQVISETEKKAPLKNLLILSIGWALFFTGFAALSNLQSTMNVWQNTGVKSQAIIYFFSMLSSLFLPKIVIRHVGCKRTFVLMIAFNCFYIAANFYPSDATLFTSAALFGLTSGPQNTAQNLYIVEMASRYAVQTRSTTQHTSAFFYGILAFFTANTQIWGNVISYLVLSPSVAKSFSESPNASLDTCGVYFDPDFAYANNSFDGNSNLVPPSNNRRCVLVSIYTSLGVLSAVLMAICLDPLRNDRDAAAEKRSALGEVFAAVTHMKTVNQFLLLPLTIFVGLEIAFYQADFTQAFIACYWGIYNVGFVSICFGVSGALSALCVGPLVKRFGQLTLISTAAVLNVAGCVVMMSWTRGTAVLFIAASIWGAADSVWWSQIPALYSEVFSDNKEAGFSNFWFWSFLGFFMSFSYASHISTSEKIYILLCFLVLGMVGCVILRVKRRTSYLRI